MEGQSLGPEAIGTTELKPGQSLETQTGKVEILLTPGVFFGLGDNSSAMMISPSLTDTELRLDKGEATVDRSDSLTARITAEVVDVKPNGTLVLQAHKFIKTDDEEQEFTLTGTCRAEDVTPDNSVLSTTLHDLNVKKNSKGAARDTTKRGWVPRLLDFINPF